MNEYERAINTWVARQMGLADDAVLDVDFVSDRYEGCETCGWGGTMDSDLEFTYKTDGKRFQVTGTRSDTMSVDSPAKMIEEVSEILQEQRNAVSDD